MSHIWRLWLTCVAWAPSHRLRRCGERERADESGCWRSPLHRGTPSKVSTLRRGRCELMSRVAGAPRYSEVLPARSRAGHPPTGFGSRLVNGAFPGRDVLAPFACPVPGPGQAMRGQADQDNSYPASILGWISVHQCHEWLISSCGKRHPSAAAAGPRPSRGRKRPAIDPWASLSSVAKNALGRRHSEMPPYSVRHSCALVSIRG